jgi:hypothetical protein
LSTSQSVHSNAKQIDGEENAGEFQGDPLLARDAEDSDFDVRAYDRCAGRVLRHRD